MEPHVRATARAALIASRAACADLMGAQLAMAGVVTAGVVVVFGVTLLVMLPAGVLGVMETLGAVGVESLTPLPPPPPPPHATTRILTATAVLALSAKFV